MATQQAYLTTANLSVGYRQKQADNQLFSNLNLSLKAGEMICFMGPNGAGKSSLLRTLAGLQKPLSGSITIHPPESNETKEHQVAVVLTDRVNAVNLTVEEIVAFGRYPYLGWNIQLTARDVEAIRFAIDHVRLQPLLRKKLYELSDGQLQMAMIGRAIAQDTPVILLDEPTAHLDLNNRVEIMNLLRQLSRTTGKAILLATHELDLALQTADLIWLTGNDRNILQGLPEDLVLRGAFDEIFRFKGFDLKSGKVIHHPFRNTAIKVTGVGSTYLWTRNALERNGYEVTSDDQDVSVSIADTTSGIKWIVKKIDTHIEIDSIEKLLNTL